MILGENVFLNKGITKFLSQEMELEDSGKASCHVDFLRFFAWISVLVRKVRVKESTRSGSAI